MNRITIHWLVTCVMAANLSVPAMAQTTVPTPTPTPITPMSTTTARIDGVPVLDWMTSGQTTFCGALSAALSVTDRPRPVAGEIFGQKTAFLGPWSGKSIADWTAAVRAREIDILTKMRDADKGVIQHIRTVVE